MLIGLSLVQWFAFLLGSVIVLFFAVIGIRALIILVKLIWRSLLGQVVEFNEECPDNILTAITPLKRKAKRREYVKAINRLQKDNDKFADQMATIIPDKTIEILVARYNKLIEQNNKLISEYRAVIENKRDFVEDKNDDTK